MRRFTKDGYKYEFILIGEHDVRLTFKHALEKHRDRGCMSCNADIDCQDYAAYSGLCVDCFMEQVEPPSEQELAQVAERMHQLDIEKEMARRRHRRFHEYWRHRTSHYISLDTPATYLDSYYEWMSGCARHCHEY